MSRQNLLEFLTKQGSTLPEETLRIEQWDREITLRGLSSRERDLFEAENMRRANAKAGNGAAKRGMIEPDLTNFRARLVSRHIIEGGMRTFANERGEELLGDQPAVVLDRLFAVAQRLSGFTQEDIQELAKNSGATDASEQNTDLPVSSDAPSQNSNAGSPNQN